MFKQCAPFVSFYSNMLLLDAAGAEADIQGQGSRFIFMCLGNIHVYLIGTHCLGHLASKQWVLDAYGAEANLQGQISRFTFIVHVHLDAARV